MNSRSVILLGIVLLVVSIATLSVGQAQPRAEQPATKRRCVGISTAILHTNPVITRVYRVFDDGTTETYDDGAPDARWKELGK